MPPLLSLGGLFLSQNAYADKFVVGANKLVFNPGDNLIIYGKGSPDDTFAIRLFDPVGIAVKIDTIASDHDGFFREGIFRWPEPTPNLAFGTYSIEIASSTGTPYSQKIDVVFAEQIQDLHTNTGNNSDAYVSHILSVKLDAPTELQLNKSSRIYVQITFDGALVDSDDPTELLGRSHIHSGNSTINLTNSFKKLHEGLYFADVTLSEEGSYIIHAIAFNKGYLSHDSKVVSVNAATLGTLQDSINDLDERLNSADNELKNLQTSLNEARSTINDTKVSINDSVNQARDSIGQDVDSAKTAVIQVRDATGQINSIILPVMALISIILALQITLFARIRASYR